MDYMYIVATLLAPIVPALLIHWLSRKGRAIRWVALTPKSMMEIADEVSDRLQVTLDGKKVRNLTKYTFILHNNGRNELVEAEIVKPLKWTGPGVIIDARVVRSDPSVELALKAVGRDLEIRWELFNQRCQALIEVICDAETEDDGGTVSSQIKGVPQIEVQNRRHVDEEEIRKGIRRNISRLPKLFQYLESEQVTVYVRRYTSQILTIYCTIPLGTAVMVIGDLWFGLATETSVGIGMALIVSLSTTLLFYFRNPYAKLLKGQTIGRR